MPAKNQLNSVVVNEYLYVHENRINWLKFMLLRSSLSTASLSINDQSVLGINIIMLLIYDRFFS